MKRPIMLLLSILLVSVFCLNSCCIKIKLPNIFDKFNSNGTHSSINTDGQTNINTSTNTDTEDITPKDDAWIQSFSISEQKNDGQTFVNCKLLIQSTIDSSSASIDVFDLYGNKIHSIEGIVISAGTSIHNISFSVPQLEDIYERDKEDAMEESDVAVNMDLRVLKIELSTSLEEANYDNNVVYTSIKEACKGKILIVYGDGTQLEQIEKAGDKIDLSEYDVEKTSSANFPRSLEKMLEYDEIIFMNVDFEELSNRNSNAINNIKRYVEEIGRGVLFTLGDNIFDEKNCTYVDSEINEIFPVELQNDEQIKNAGMVLVIDLSPSMKEQLDDSGYICKVCDYYASQIPEDGYCYACKKTTEFAPATRFHIVKEATKSLIKNNSLSSTDYLGVILFDQDYHVALEMQPIGDEKSREDVCEKIEYEMNHYYYAYYIDKSTGEESDIRIDLYRDGEVGYGNVYVDGEDAIYTMPEGDYDIGGYDEANGFPIKSRGTSYKWPIQEASAMLARAQEMAGSLEIKQVVFMSDGAPNDKGSGYEGIVERMAKGGTVTSSIAIGISATDTSAISELEKISVAGKGDLFLVKKASDLDEDLAGIVESIKGELLNKDITVLPMRDSMNSTVHAGMLDIEYDFIHGYYGSQIKENAERVIYVDNLRPLYAEWDYGLGKVCIFMSDLGSKDWTGEMFDDTDGKKNTLLIKNILVAPIQNRINSTGISYEVVKGDKNITIIAETYKDLATKKETIDGTLYTEKLKAMFYKYDEKAKMWLRYSETLPQAVGDSKYIVSKDIKNDIYIVVIEQLKYKDGEIINYQTDLDDPLCDRVVIFVGE